MPSRASLRTASHHAGPLCDSATVHGDSIGPTATIPPTRKRPHDSFYDHSPLRKRVKLDDGENEKWGYLACNDLHSQPAIFSTTTSPASTATPSNSGAGLSPIGVSATVLSTVPLINGLDQLDGEAAHQRVEQRNRTAAAANSKLKPEPDKRTLRSQDGGSRSKSELALYFPNYEELISTEPKEAEFLTPSMTIHVIDDQNLSSPSSSPYPPNPLFPTSPKPISKSPAPTPPQTDLTTFETLDFSLSSTQTPTTSHDDPLSPSHYFPSHRRAERQEKQLRNIEKERAQHEKVQLDRLLDGLKGHDWLRVMGISGITDTEKKTFEGKRDYFIREVESLLAKFRRWKEEEKRRKIEKEISETADSEGEEDDDDNDDEEDDDEDEEDAEDEDAAAGGDVDSQAARQLHREARSQARRKKKPRLLPPLLALGPPPEEKPFTSFYAKPYLREAALGKHRRGRTRFAFGSALPEVGEQEFELPEDFLTEDRIRASRRRGRAARRGEKAEA